MAELNLPNIREGGNIRFRIGLEDGGVAVDWSGLEDIRVFLYADAQKQVSGEMCEVAVDEEDNTVLKCKYSGDDVQYRGINSVLVRAKYLGEIKVYDKPAINIVARTSDATGVVEIDDPVVPVQISVEDVSTSLLNNAIDAAINAAAEAEKAAHLVPLQVLEDCVEATGKALEAASKAPYIDETTGNWFVWDAEAGEYVDSGKTARGATGNGIASWSVVESQEDAGNNVVTVTFTDGTSESFNVKNGHTGNGIASIVQTVESPDDAGTNVITITMTNGTVVTFNVKNGSKGTPGVAQAAYKSVSSLPTASAQTMDKIYDGSAYSWQDLGTTAIQLSDYATKAELNQLEAKVNEFATGKFYGNFASSEDLPEDAGVEGFAYVGESLPYAIWNFNGTAWVDSGVTIKQRPDTINTIESQEIAGLGEEIISANGWTLGAGWSGNLENGFSHASGNTAPLTFAMPVATGTKLFQVTFRSSVDATDTNILVSVGNSETFPLYGQPQPYGIGIKSVSDGNLVFTPESSFTGTLTEISIKEVISETEGVRKVIDSNEQIALETRSTLANLRNIFIGLNAGKLNTSGYGNVAVGAFGLQSNTSGFWNIAIGRETLYSNTVGSRNVAVGYGALNKNISGNRNIAIGSFSLINNTTGNHNISIGADCMNNNTTGGENVAIGFQAMYQSTSSRYNVAIGHNAMSSIKTGERNIAIGFGAGASLESGNYNLFIGSGAGQYTTSNNNIAIGFGALYRNTGGQNNVAIGNNAAAGGANASWAGNTFIGTNCAPSIKTGIVYNTFIGFGAGQALQSGGYNILIGYNVGVPTSTKSYHLNIGNLITGDMTSGSEFVKINGGLDLSSVPTTDPGVTGRVWNDNGTLKISQ